MFEKIFPWGKKTKVQILRQKLVGSGEEKFTPREIEEYGQKLLNLPLSQIENLRPKEIAKHLSKQLDKYYRPRPY